MTFHDQRVSYRKFVVPSEHGGWSLVLEPVVLGLAVVWSPAGLLIGIAALATFLAREPLRVSGSDLIVRRRRYPRTVPAGIIGAGWLSLAAALLLVILVRHGWQPLIPIALAGPLAFAQAIGDLYGSGRRLGFEIGGAIAMSASTPVIVLLGSEGRSSLALVLWFFIVSRSIGAILYVRERLSKTKSKTFSVLPPVVAHVVALAIAASLYVVRLAPASGIAGLAILLGRTLHGFRSNVAMTPRLVGALEVGWGIVMISLVAFGYRFDFF